ncbi:MAG: hypothetical protein KDA68_22930 [Planctomycetaceae bacterium]|nr:hypothetical protein [Planctomycetaceae bacterium]
MKGFRYEDLYTRELRVYKRLRENGIGKIGRFSVPELIDFDESLWMIEMQIVSPPFVLDFAGASVDHPPEYPVEIQEESQRQQAELFEDRWPEVRSLLSSFRRYGIYLTDIHPRNINFGEFGSGG